MMQPIKASILFSDFGPYHIVRIEALAAHLATIQIELVAYRFALVGDTYSWKPLTPVGLPTITLLKKYPKGVMDAFRLAMTFYKSLKQKNVKMAFMPSYSPLPNTLCLLAAKLAGAKAVLMSESWSATEQSGKMGSIAKKGLMQLFSAGIVGGTQQKAYAVKYGLAATHVFVGYDVVDNAYFHKAAIHAKTLPLSDWPIPPLPARFFLNIGRFVPKKNLTTLLKAYADFLNLSPQSKIWLLLVGEGTEESLLRQQAAQLGLHVQNGIDFDSNNPPGVLFYPFQQLNTLPFFYSHCEAFILPSTYEEWGLVVNEAMASAKPVLVSTMVGCSQDLVLHEKTGFVFSPNDSQALTQLLLKFEQNPVLSATMGEAAAEAINHWSPAAFGKAGLSVAQLIFP